MFVKGIWVACAVGAVRVFLLASVAQAVGAGFFDGFDTFDVSRWSKGDHALGRSHLNPANVDVAGGNARLKIPASTLQGAELRSNEFYHHGTYSTRMRLPHAPSSITGFFLYRPPDHEREIDIEVFNDSTRRVMFTTYSGGRQTHTVTKKLPFDPTAGYHTYAFRYDAGLARFIVDGNVMQTWKTGVPKGSMYLYTNLWFPTWLDGKKPLTDRYLQVDWTRYKC
jgi:endo-1,3-1,4-beta-glycanase ExoK